MNKIFVTGCAGFIGQRTCEMLLKDGIEVVGIDNLNNYYDIRLKKWRLNELKKNNNFYFYNINIENLNALKKIFNKFKFDSIINLASGVGVRYSMENPFIYAKTNITGTLNLLEMMRYNGINKMVLASTSSLYAGENLPFNEELAVNKPISPYAATKKSAEVLCYSYHYLFNLDITVVRYFTVYGPASRPDMGIFRFIESVANGRKIELFGDGNQSRDFTYVDDIARGTIDALKKLGYETINLGGGENPISINYVIGKIEEYIGKKALIDKKEFNKADMLETRADITKAEKILNWKPEVDFDTGLKKTVTWHLENKEWLKNIKL